MERLALSETSRYDAFEAAIHLARYSIARQVCEGRRVLDVACGEGYGSSLLRRWGACSVVGVDVSEAAVDACRRNFGDAATFVCAKAEDIGAGWPAGSFDLIVSLETIEHVDDPAAFLNGVRTLLAPDGVAIVSCPNDWWYYPDAASGNPYHKRKLTFLEFQSMAEEVLGKASGYLFGGPLAGFYSFDARGVAAAGSHDSQMLMLSRFEGVRASRVPADVGKAVRAEDASYFVGIWGASKSVSEFEAAVVVPGGMDMFRNGVFAAFDPRNVAAAEAEAMRERQLAAEAGSRVEKLDHVLRDAFERVSAAEKDRECARRDLSAVAEEAESLTAQLSQTTTEVVHLRNEAERLREELEKATARNESLNAQLVAANAEAGTARVEGERLERQLENAAAECESMRLRLSSAQAELESATRNLRHTSLRLRAVEAEAALAKEGVGRLRLVERDLWSRIDSINLVLDAERRVANERAAELTEIGVLARRYQRIRDLIPVSIRRLIMSLYRGAKRAL